jgi:hypothetical protein
MHACYIAVGLICIHSPNVTNYYCGLPVTNERTNERTNEHTESGRERSANRIYWYSASLSPSYCTATLCLGQTLDHQSHWTSPV